MFKSILQITMFGSKTAVLKINNNFLAYIATSPSWTSMCNEVVSGVWIYC